MADPLWDATFRARLLRQGLSADEMAQAVEAAESAAARAIAAAPDYDEQAIKDALWAVVDAVLAPCDPARTFLSPDHETSEARILEQVVHWIADPTPAGYTLPASPDDVFWLLAQLEEAREQVALCAADTTAVDLRQRVEFVRSVLDRHAEINAARERPERQVADLISEVRHQLDDREGRPAGGLS